MIIVFDRCETTSTIPTCPVPAAASSGCLAVKSWNGTSQYLARLPPNSQGAVSRGEDKIVVGCQQL